MKPIGVLVFAVVAFTSFSGIICNPVDVEIEPNCDAYIPIPGIGLACNKMRKPVCGTNGRTYLNECELCSHKMKMNTKQDSIKIKYRNSCRDEDEQPQDECQKYGEACTMDYRPVCGSDGVTYPNKCGFCGAKKRIVGLSLVSEGKCQEKNEQPQDECQKYGEACTMDYRPVCGSDGVTYPNKCGFCGAKKRIFGLSLVSEGKCKEKNEQPQDECQTYGNACTFIYKPVCGSDGETYSNKCLFCGAKKRIVGLRLVSEGKCQEKDEQPQDECQKYGEACTMDYRPVCGSDGVTYPNKCGFCGAKKRIFGLSLVSEGKCKEKDEQHQDECQTYGDACPFIYKPVCGSDGETYSNKCLFCGAKKRKADLLVVSDGKCEPKDECHGVGGACNRMYKPVCGSDAVSYPNKCEFCNSKKRNADLQVVSEGECEPRDECHGVGGACNRMYKPVCGSDAVTYPNKCEFCNSKKRNADLLVVSEGECEPRDECHGVGGACNRMYKPVCGSDAVSYPNKCEFCNAKKRNAGLLVVADGECQTKDEQPQDECQKYGNFCTMDYRPVCGSDGVTYPNKCGFCGAKKRNAELMLMSDGECAKKTY